MISRDMLFEPLGDLRPHVDSASCWCRPTLDEEEPLVLIHHAMDQRESYENGRSLS